MNRKYYQSRHTGAGRYPELDETLDAVLQRHDTHDVFTIDLKQEQVFD